MKPVWIDRSISLSSKIPLMRSLVISIVLYACEYKPWKWDAIARYYAFLTKTMLPTRKFVPRSSRQLDYTKNS